MRRRTPASLPLPLVLPRYTPHHHLTQEVTVDGICVLSKAGPFKREWMIRFPRRRGQNNDYELHVKDDRIEVRLGKKTIWGVTVER